MATGKLDIRQEIKRWSKVPEETDRYIYRNRSTGFKQTNQQKKFCC